MATARAISFLILVMFPELSSVGVSRFHTMHIAFRGSRKGFSAKVPTIACAQRQSDKRKVHVVKNLSCNLCKVYPGMLTVPGGSVNCKRGLV